MSGKNVSRPALPPGYHDQPAWGLRDSTGRLAFDFTRVYGPPDLQNPRGPVCRLDEERCYWGVTWPMFTDAGGYRPVGRWMSYAGARELRPGLSFTDFSSLEEMRTALPALLQVEALPVASPSTQEDDINPPASLLLAYGRLGRPLLDNRGAP